MNSLITFSIFTAFVASLIITLIFFVLEINEKENEFLKWSKIAWFLYAVRFIAGFLARKFDSDLLSFSTFLLAVLSGLFLFKAILYLLEKQFKKIYLTGASLLVLWLVVVLAASLNFVYMAVPTYLFLSFIYLYSGYSFLKSDLSDKLGYKLAGLFFIIWGIHKLDFPYFLFNREIFHISFLISAGMAFLVGASLLIAAFEKAKVKEHTAQKTLQNILDNSTDIIFNYQLIPEEKFIYINPSCKNITGYSSEEFISDPGIFKNFISAEDDKNISDRLKAGNTTPLILTLKHRDGEIKWIELRVRKVINEINNSVHITGIARDITESKKAEEAIQKSENQLYEAQKIANLGRYSFKIPENIWTGSDILYQIFGIDENYKKDVEGWLNIIHPEEKKVLSDYLYHHVIMEKNPFDLEYRIIRVYDKKERWVHGKGKIIYDKDDKPLEMLGTITDITKRKKAEIALAKSENRYRSLINSLSEGVLLISKEGEVVAFNETAKKFLEDANVFNKSINILREIIVDENGEFIPWDKFPINKTFITGIPVKNYVIGFPNNGQVTWMSVNTQPIFGSAKNLPEQVVASYFDITEIKNSQDQLRKFTRAVDQSRVSILISDIKGNVEYVNPMFTEITGYSEEEIIGQNTNFLKSGLTDDKIFTELWETITSGDDWSGVLVNKKKNNDIIYESTIISPIKDEKGNITNFVSVREDITERLKAQEELKNYKSHLEELVEERTKELKKSRESFAALAENSSDSIMRFDVNLKHIYINKSIEKRLNLNRNDIIGKRPAEFDFLKDVSAGWENELKLALGSRKKRLYEMKHPTDEWFEYSIIPEFDENDNTSSLLVFGHNITARKKLEESITKSLEKERELNRLKSQFISLASHELRTPLTTIYSSTELIESYGNEWSFDKLLNHTGRIKNSVENLTELMEDMLMITRVDSGKMVLNPSQVNLRQLIDKVISGLEPILTNEHVLNTDIRLKEKKIVLDHKLTRYIISNLLSNAVKYSPGGGEIKISVFDENEELKIEVLDHGIGIPEEDIKNLFEPFYRAENTEEFSGTGLGLSIVKKSVELHGGSITVESRLNEFTLFRIKLPLRINFYNE